MNTKQMNKFTVFGAIMLLVSMMAGTTASAQNIPNAKIIVIDNTMLSTNSAVAKDIQRQMRQLQSEMQLEVTAQETALQAEQQELQSQANLLPQDAYNQRAEPFRLKRNEYLQNVQRKNLQLERALIIANAEIERALKPILQKVLQDNGATMMMDKANIVEQAPGLDVTTQIIEQLDLALPTYTVVLPDLPEAAPAVAAPAPQQ